MTIIRGVMKHYGVRIGRLLPLALAALSLILQACGKGGSGGY